MVKSVLQKPLSQSNVSRNAFDVGYSNKFTSSLGMLLPCFVRECNPDEHYRINAILDKSNLGESEETLESYKDVGYLVPVTN